MIEPDEKLSIQDQCGLLSLSRSGYYYVPEQETELNLRLLRRIDELHVAEPTWGSRMLRDKLALEGDVVNRKRIKRLMAILRIKVIYPGKNLSKRNQEHKVYPYLLRGLAIPDPTRYGVPTSPTSGCAGGGCIWWPFWTGPPVPS